jgi:hypothetical protein
MRIANGSVLDALIERAYRRSLATDPRDALLVIRASFAGQGDTLRRSGRDLRQASSQSEIEP